jgi:hypothetical protein
MITGSVVVEVDLMLSANEGSAIQELRRRLIRLASYLATKCPPQSDCPVEWYGFLAGLKDELGNLNNGVSLIATLLAKDYLVSRLSLAPFDAAAKAQGASGLDIDERTREGARVIAEIKTTHPYKADDLGAQQASSFKKDASKLRNTKAEHKFFFVTDSTTFEVMKKPKYRSMFDGIRVVLLPSGAEVTA